VLRDDSNPSGPVTNGKSRRRVAVVRMPAKPRRHVSVVLPVPESTFLAERIERVRIASAEQRAHSLALLERCAATRQRAARSRAERLSSLPQTG
jgi:hypothetical protein